VAKYQTMLEGYIVSIYPTHAALSAHENIIKMQSVLTSAKVPKLIGYHSNVPWPTVKLMSVL